jgi:hypothetical protein
LFNQENAGCPEITITALDGKAFSIKGFTSTGNLITAEYDPNMVATRFILKPKVNMDQMKEYPDGSIKIDLIHPESNNIIIPFNIVSEFKITPPQILAFNAQPGEPIYRKIWVFSNYGKDFEIESTSSQNNIIKVQSYDKIQNGFQFMLEIMPPAAEGKTRFKDVLFIKIKDSEKLSITFNGFYLRKK